MATGPVCDIHTPSPPFSTFANSRGLDEEPPRGLVSTPRGLSLSYQPYPRGRKGGSTGQQLRSTSLFTISSTISWIGISLRETYFSILNMLRIFRPREIFKTCDEVGPGFARSFAFFGNRIQFCLERMCGLVWSEVYWLISIKSCLAASSSFLTFKRFCLTVVKKFPNSFSNVIFVLKLDKEIEWRESCNR